MKTSNKIYRFAMLTLLLWIVFVGCKKDEIPTAPVVDTPPTVITPDPGPVEGDYRIIITDSSSEIGMITRLSKYNIDIMAGGKRDADGFITDITSVLISNPNSKAWLGAEIDKGYPVKLVSSTGYVAELKDYNKANKTVMATILLDGKVIQGATIKKLNDSFFENIDQYNKVKNGRLADLRSECEKTKKAMSALGTVANAMGCVGGFVYPPAGLIGGLGWLNSCYGAIDGAFEFASGKSLTERVWGKENGQTVKDVLFASSFLNATANPKAVGELLNKALGWYGKAADGSGYVPCDALPNAHSTGDPHLTTPDGLRYSFQGHGEFIATKSTFDNFEVQVRQEDPNKSGTVTMNTAVAVQSGSDAVCVTVIPDRLFINKQAQNLTTFTTLALKEGASVVKNKINGYEVIDINTKNGDLVRVRFHGSYLLDYSLFLQDNRKTKLMGILGNFDGDKTNDVTVRNGESIMKNGSLPFDKLYPTFADSWRITQANSLFYYDAGKNTDSYTQKDFPRSPTTITAEQRTKAEGICRAAGVTTEPFLSNCIIDVAITDDPTLASSSLWGQSINTLPASLPVPIIQEAVDVKAMRSIENAAFVLKADGSLWASGWNDHGFFGVGGQSFTEPATKDKFIKIMGDIKGIATGSQGTHNLFLKNDNSVWAAGYNQQGQIGNGATDGKNVRTAIKIMDDGKTLATGTYRSFVIKTDNTLWAWGEGGRELGSGIKDGSFKPIKIMENVKAVSTGEWHTLILKTDNTLWVTGSNAYGEWGTGSSTYETQTPIKIMDGVKSMTAAGHSSYIIKNDNSLWVSGNNYTGQLGIGTSGNGTDIKTFQKLMDNVALVDGNNIATFILKTDHTLWVTGHNRDGQFGDGTSKETTITKPKQVATGVKSVITSGRAGYLENRTFILKIDNTIWAAGNSINGILGDGTTTTRLTFVPINVK